jgi:hypothetical protein
MKPAHGFWLVFGVLLYWSLVEILALLGLWSPWFTTIYTLGTVLFAAGTFYICFSKALRPTHRVMLFLAGLAMISGPLVSWWSEWAMRTGVSQDFFELLEKVWLVRLGVLALVALVLGAAVTTQRLNRFFLLLAVLAIGAFLWGGPEALAGLGMVVAGLIAAAIFVAIFVIFAIGGWKAGEEDARLMREGKPPKHYPLIDPNNPYSPFKKK